MKIATFINERGEVGSFSEKGQVCLYEQVSGVWIKNKEILLDVNRDMGLSDVKARLKEIATGLNDNKILLVAETRGLLCLLFQEMGFRTWTSEGSLFEQLDNVARREKEAARNDELKLNESGRGQSSCGCKARNPSSHINNIEERIIEPIKINRPIPAPILVGDGLDGYYRINLAEVLKNDPGLNSKEVLIPFMNAAAFRKLEIICDHLPRWFSREIDQLSLRTESKALDASGHGIIVIVVPK